MLAYCPESYAFQAWSTVGDGDYLLDNNTWATSVLSLKLGHMAGRVNLDGSSPSRATSLAGLAGSAMPCSPVHSPSRSHSRTPTKGGEGDLIPAPHLASFLGGLSQNPPLPPTLMKAAVAAQHLKMTASPMVRLKQALMTEPLTVMVIQMMKALAVASMAVKKHQMMRAPSRMAQTMKVRGLVVRQRGQMLKVATAP